MKIIIASHNPGKIKEFKELLEPLNMEVLTLSDYPEIPEVEETGATFEENAIIKAQAISHVTGCLALADDSGLVVPSLNGEPGIYSARYSGAPKNDQRNIDKLLKKMENFEGDCRKAYFNTSIAVTFPGKEPLIVAGQAHGIILQQGQGQDGFGYDPVFYYPPLDRTFAQLDSATKNQVSHRGQAIKALMMELPEWLEGIDKA